MALHVAAMEHGENSEGRVAGVGSLGQQRFPSVSKSRWRDGGPPIIATYKFTIT